MQVVIEIPEEEYKFLDYYQSTNHTIFKAIKNGTVLPERHGRLIDADKLFQQVGIIKPKSQTEHDDIGNLMSLITCAPTIIEAKRGW